MRRRFISVAEAGRVLGLGPSQARRLAASGVLPTVRLSPDGRRFVPREALDAWLAQKATEALTAANRVVPFDRPRP